jgi:xanthine dehydrogenase accessory factor
MLSIHKNNTVVIIRGGGDLASGVALRLFKAGFRIVVTELPRPLMVRRSVSFGQAVFDGTCRVEEVTGELAATPLEAQELMQTGKVAVMVDPKASSCQALAPVVLVDGRMTKLASDQRLDAAPRVIGLGPGFTAGVNCHAVIETRRGHTLGRVYWQGSAEPDNSIPEPVLGLDVQRVLHAPANGRLVAQVMIGDVVEKGTLVAKVDGIPVLSKIKGAVRGLIQDGMVVKRGMKIGDIDPRCDVSLCFQVSDKALAVGGGVLEAMLGDPPGQHPQEVDHESG